MTDICQYCGSELQTNGCINPACPGRLRPTGESSNGATSGQDSTLLGPAPAEVEDLLDHIISAANSVSIPSESNYLNELKSRLLAALSNKGENLSGDVIVPGTEMIPKEWPDDSISIPDNPDEWTDADYENAMALVRPIFDQIGTYEAKHFPMDEPSREAQEEFRRDQMGEVLIIDHHQSLLELGNILFHDARPTNEIESTGIKKYWLSKSRIIPYKKIK